MPTKPKYKYDIKKIEELANEGYSIRAIARYMGWPEDNTQQWLNRNYKKTIKYVPKNKGGVTMTKNKKHKRKVWYRQIEDILFKSRSSKKSKNYNRNTKI